MPPGLVFHRFPFFITFFLEVFFIIGIEYINLWLSAIENSVFTYFGFSFFYSFIYTDVSKYSPICTRQSFEQSILFYYDTKKRVVRKIWKESLIQLIGSPQSSPAMIIIGHYGLK